MIGSQKIACVIPARLQSTRFPKKMLISIKGKPLLQWVWEAAHKCVIFDKIIFATDSEEIGHLIKSFGGSYYMTSLDCPSGTDRLCELYQKGAIDADIWVNWQGDEPFIRREMIADLLKSAPDKSCDLWTLKKKIIAEQDVIAPNIVKVVCDIDENALYFSRSPIPFYRDPSMKKQEHFKHIGIYAYRKEALAKIANLSSCDLEKAEQLEQLRFLYNGMKIRVHETTFEVLGIDLPEHLAKAEAYVESGQHLG